MKRSFGKQKNHIVYHIGKNLVPAICKAQKGNCPYGGKENHFTSLLEAEKIARKIQEGSFDPLPFMQGKTSKIELKDHHGPEEFFSYIKGYIKTLKEKKSKIEKVVEKSYMVYLEECAKDEIETVISREKFFKGILKKLPEYTATVDALTYKEKLLEDSSIERSQTDHFLKHFTPLDLSYSIKTTSSYFILDVNDWEAAQEYLRKNGYSFQVRSDVNLQENFEIRFANHLPSKMYHKKDIDIWSATGASILVDYRKEILKPTSENIELKDTKETKVGKIYNDGIPTKKFKDILYKFHGKEKPEYNGEIITKDNIHRIANEINSKPNDNPSHLLKEANILRIAYQTLKLEGKPYKDLQEESLRRRALAERS